MNKKQPKIKLTPEKRLGFLKVRDDLHEEWAVLRLEVDSLLLIFRQGDFERWDVIENRKVAIAKLLRKVEEKILAIDQSVLDKKKKLSKKRALELKNEKISA